MVVSKLIIEPVLSPITARYESAEKLQPQLTAKLPASAIALPETGADTLALLFRVLKAEYMANVTRNETHAQVLSQLKNFNDQFAWGEYAAADSLWNCVVVITPVQSWNVMVAEAAVAFV